MIWKFLEDVFVGESMVYMRYFIFVEQVEREGFYNIVKFFRVIVYVEFVYVKNYFIVFGKFGKIFENLQMGIEGEIFEVEEMYFVYKNFVEFQEEKDVVRMIYYVFEVEKIYVEFYKKVKEKVEKGEDIEIKRVYICLVCGYMVVDEVFEYCFVCGVLRDKFVVFE